MKVEKCRHIFPLKDDMQYIEQKLDVEPSNEKFLNAFSRLEII